MNRCKSCTPTRMNGHAKRFSTSQALASSPVIARSPNTLAPSGIPGPARSTNRRNAGHECSGREELRLDILECLELQGIPGRVQEKQGGLLARLTLEADVRLDDKLHAVLFQPLSQPLPVAHFQHDAKVWNGHTMPIHRVVVGGDASIRTQAGVQMTHKLVPEQVEIHPFTRTAPLGTPEQPLVEAARFLDVAHLDSN